MNTPNNQQGQEEEVSPEKMAIELFFENRKLHHLLADICGCSVYSDVETYKKFAPKSYHGTATQPTPEGISPQDLIMLAGRIFPIYDEQDFDDSLMDYDDYVKSQNDQREAFISGYKKAAALSTAKGEDKNETK